MEVSASMVRMGWHQIGLLAHLPLRSSQRLLKSIIMSSGTGPIQYNIILIRKLSRRNFDTDEML